MREHLPPDDQITRTLADMNGDGVADIGFGIPGLLVSLATGDGNFTAPIFDRAMFNPANGWTSDEQFHRGAAAVARWRVTVIAGAEAARYASCKP